VGQPIVSARSPQNRDSFKRHRVPPVNDNRARAGSVKNPPMCYYPLVHHEAATHLVLELADLRVHALNLAGEFGLKLRIDGLLG